MSGNRTLLSMIAVVMLVSIPGLAVAQQSDPINGFSVSYAGQFYDSDNDRTTFVYTVSGTGEPPALSHFDIALPFCAPTLVLVDFSPAQAVSIGTDPTTGISGIKWDLPLEVDETRTYSITFEGFVVEGVVQVAVKGGPGFEIASLPGPSCLVPSIHAGKSLSLDGATWLDASAPPGPAVEPGTDVWFRFVVANDGDVPLTGITLTDSHLDLSVCQPLDPLAPGESFDCILGPFAAVSGQHTNTAVAAGVFAGITYSNSASANYFGGVPTPTSTPTSTATPTPEPPPAVGGECPFSQGYWKNHPQAWPVPALTLGGQTYTQAELLTILHTPTRGDASIILAYQLIAAKLNIANGSDPAPVADLIAQADGLLGGYGGKLPYGVAPSSSAGQSMVGIAGTLDQFNNGQLTPDCGTTPPVVIEGPVTEIDGNIIVINNVYIWLAPNDPLLTVLRIGDVLRVEGHYQTRGTLVVLVAVIVVFADVSTYVVSTSPDITIYLSDDGDWDCKNPPPPWAPAHGWRRKCGGVVPEPGSRGR